MSKTTALFIMLFMFATGISIGMGVAIFKTATQNENISKSQDSIQDIVMKTVQANQDEKYEVEEVMSKNEEKISPYAKMTVEKFYTECGHTTVDIYNVPVELVNLTEEELKMRYENWEIKKFTSNDIHIYREINANCSMHFVLKEKDGYVAVYKAISNDITEFQKLTDIAIASLTESDYDAINAGVEIYGSDELEKVVQKYLEKSIDNMEHANDKYDRLDDIESENIEIN